MCSSRQNSFVHGHGSHNIVKDGERSCVRLWLPPVSSCQNLIV